MLSKYIVKRQALWWLLVFFYIKVDQWLDILRYLWRTTNHKASYRAKDQPRKFLKELANMLYMPSIEA